MTHSFTFVAALAVLLASVAPSMAQDTTEAPAGDVTAEDAPAEPTVDNGLDLGEAIDAPAAPQPGEPYIREVFSDWAFRCIRVEDGPEPCQLYQLLLDQDDNPIAEVSIVPLAPGGEAVAGAVIVVPLETQLTEQLTLSIDGSQARRYPFDFCNRAGCVARFGMNDDQINQLKAGSAGRITIVPAQAPDQEVVLTMSLIGFTAGFNATAAPPE